MRFFLPELIYYTYFFFSLQMQKNEVQIRELLPLCNFLLVPNAPKKIFDYVLPTDVAYCFKYNIILCQVFFQQTGTVKSLPQHNPITLTLRFFFYRFQ